MTSLRVENTRKSFPYYRLSLLRRCSFSAVSLLYYLCRMVYMHHLSLGHSPLIPWTYCSTKMTSPLWHQDLMSVALMSQAHEVIPGTGVNGRGNNSGPASGSQKPTPVDLHNQNTTLALPITAPPCKDIALSALFCMVLWYSFDLLRCRSHYSLGVLCCCIFQRGLPPFHFSRSDLVSFLSFLFFPGTRGQWR